MVCTPEAKVELRVQVPEAVSVLAAIGPDIDPVLVKVPVLVIPLKALSVPLSVQGPDTERVLLSEVAALADSVVAACGPLIAPVLEMVPVFVMPLVVDVFDTDRVVLSVVEALAEREVAE